MANIIQIPSQKLGYAIVPILLAVQALLFPPQALAQTYLQCVPYARQLSGIQIYGDAHTWWKQSKGRYQRGEVPIEGSVLSLKSHGKMRLGHVAVVSKVIDSRNILLSHANWSPINGRRGQIERNVAAIDVSRNNDWSQVKIWYAPIRGMGKTAYPVNGFIYPNHIDQKRIQPRQWAVAKTPPQGRAPNRNLFARQLTIDLQQKALSERYVENKPQKVSADPIGDLLDTLGN